MDLRDELRDDDFDGMDIEAVLERLNELFIYCFSLKTLSTGAAIYTIPYDGDSYIITFDMRDVCVRSRWF